MNAQRHSLHVSALLMRMQRYVRDFEEMLEDFRAGRELPLGRRGPVRGSKRVPQIVEMPGRLEAMHRDHVNGMILEDLHRKYGHMPGAIKKAFLRHGLQVIDRGNRGCFPKTLRRRSEEEIRAAVAASKRFCVPADLRSEWKEDWDLKKRSWLIGLLVEKHGWPQSRPETPLSEGLTFFDYTTPQAHEVAAEMNAGRASQQWCVHLKVCSRGVIFERELWFWNDDNGYQKGHHTPGKSRPVLHRVLYVRHHGPIPPRMRVRHADGNPNNFAPENLILATENDLCRENQTTALNERSRARTAALLNFNPDPVTKIFTAA